ncbi:MAG: glycosyltransferase, partial [Pseudobutyrivibrio sp.]|nr:glycosyltransferase [Pseudobutyrivibrio sp.]
WASIVVIIVFLNGMNMFFVGVMGQYLSKTYLEVKNRPIYIVRESNTKEEK